MSDPSILPPNATQAERALAAAIAAGRADLAPVGQLMNPATCPAHLLGWLAWSFSVDTWQANWSEDQKRAVLSDSVAVHRLKGTRGAVERALAALGFATEISEWFEHGGDPHTFRIDAYGEDVFAAGLTLDTTLLETVTRQIETVKPVRSHFSLRIGQRLDNTAWLRSALGIRQRLDHPVAPATPARRIETPICLRTRIASRATMGRAVAPVSPARRIASALVARSALGIRQTIQVTAHPAQYEEAPFHAA